MQYKYITGVSLLLYIGVMIILNIATPDRDFSEAENRKLEQAPSFSFSELFAGSYTMNFERYIADQFAMKDFWIGVKSGFEKVIGKKDYNGVYMGKDGYLLQAFKEPDKESLQIKLEALNSFAASFPDLNKYLMLVPNSVEILSNKLPPFAQAASEREWQERVGESLDKNIRFVDVYDILNTKKNEYIYYKTDHHWTTKAAFYAYQEFIKASGETPHVQSYFNVERVTDNFYGSLYSKSGLKHLSPDSIEIYVPKKKEKYKVEYFDEEENGNSKVSHSLYNMKKTAQKDKYALFLDGNHALIKISTNNPGVKKLLVIKDSYANCFIPFLTGHYSEIFVVDLRYYGGNLTELIRNNFIQDSLILYNINTFFEDASVETILDFIELDTLDPAVEAQTYNYKEFFKQDVFMGDSITDAIACYGLVEQQNVCAQIGINIDEAAAQVNNIKIANPRNIYLLYGVNDMDDRTPAEWFVEQYRVLVRNVKNRFPNANIYVQSVLPVDTTLEQRNPHFNNKHINKCNAGLLKMAEEEKVKFLNIAILLNESNKNLYESDGTHLKAPFYNLWFNYLINHLGIV
ncbi:DHHW family protein [Desulfolucanica intricata]|uniref:DHHW family protein n=1 Tax=Desulfolucanica intricata TaxID=1285191 RepID=UPI0009EEC112|nr:DHHW family protein [Desulfolucanica intricata]